MLDKKQSRLRRAKKTRMHIRSLQAVRLCVNRSSRHIYAQIISADGNTIIAQASTLDTSLRSGTTSNIDAAAAVGKLIAERAKAADIEKVAFDRSGFKYHGRIKALAEAARENGLEF